MSRAGRRKRRVILANPSQAGRADAAVLLVHGIGHQQHGSLLAHMAAPCIDALECIAEAQGFDVCRHDDGVVPGAPPRGSEPRSTLVTLVKGTRDHRILFVEAVWSDCFTPPSRRYRICWVLRSLPAALLLLAPDQRDAETLRPAESMPKPWNADEITRVMVKALRPDKLIGHDELTIFRLAWRGIVALLVIGVLMATLIGSPLLGLLLLAFPVAYLAWRRNVIGHVAVAASADPELERIHDRVRHCLEWSRQRSRRVMLVAHSQGGFIAHSLLSQPEVGRVAALVSVGSGLKPIWLLRQLNDRTVLLFAWVAIGTVGIGEAIALPMIGGFSSTLAAPINALVNVGAMLAIPPIEQRPELLSSLMGHALDASTPFSGPWEGLRRLGPLHGVLAALWAGGFFWERRLFRSAYPDGHTPRLAPVRAHRWIELSSYHDPVGRLLHPTLPAPAEERSIAVGGHPVRDHVAYFSSASILPWELAGYVLRELGIRSAPVIATAGASLSADAARRRRLRAGLLTAVIAIGTLPVVRAGGSLVAAIAGIAAVLLATSIVSSVVFNIRETGAQKRVLAKLRHAVSAGEQLDDLSQSVSRGRRVIPTLFLLMLVMVCFVTSLHLTRYPTEQSSSAGPLFWFAALALAYLLAVGAGYRPRRIYLVAGLALCWVWHLVAVPPVPHERSVPTVLAVPGVCALGVATLLCGILVYLLNTKQPA